MGGAEFAGRRVNIVPSVDVVARADIAGRVDVVGRVDIVLVGFDFARVV